MVESHTNDHVAPNRRRFLTLLLGLVQGLVALILGIPAIAYIVSPVRRRGDEVWVLLGSVGELAGSRPRRVEFTYEREAGYTVRKIRAAAYIFLEDGEPVVLSPVCTHMGCNVAWKGDSKEFRCPCHGGRFDLGGGVKGGPPPKPLRRYPTRMTGEDLEIQVG
jgi:menaquinol-cytochrome c reductase iron-sulfur subunit